MARCGKAIAADGRLSEAGRRSRVGQLVDAVCDCTGTRFADHSTPSDDAEQDFLNLTHEIVRLLGDEELFTYAIYSEADGTKNESKPSLRNAAQDRRTGQTSKTEQEARRRTVIMSVLDSLRLYLSIIALHTVLIEVIRWRQEGVSCFCRTVDSLELPPLNLPEQVQSPIDRLVPLPSTG